MSTTANNSLSNCGSRTSDFGVRGKHSTSWCRNTLRIRVQTMNRRTERSQCDSSARCPICNCPRERSHRRNLKQTIPFGPCPTGPVTTPSGACRSACRNEKSESNEGNWKATLIQDKHRAITAGSDKVCRSNSRMLQIVSDNQRHNDRVITASNRSE